MELFHLLFQVNPPMLVAVLRENSTEIIRFKELRFDDNGFRNFFI